MFATYHTSAGVEDLGQDVSGDGNARSYDVSKASATYPIRVTKWGTGAGGSKRLSGVTFNLYQSDGKGGYDSTPIQTGVTRADGMLRFLVNEPGKYAVKETDVGPNTEYDVDSAMHPVVAKSRDATYIEMPLKEVLGSLDTSSASKITIKGLSKSDDDKTGNPGPVIINVNCDYDPKNIISENHAAPNIVLEDSQGNEIGGDATGENSESSRVLWNFYRTSGSEKLAQDTSNLTDLPAGFDDKPVLNLADDQIYGSVLAPDFNVYLGGSAHLYGMIAANQVALANGGMTTRVPLNFKVFEGGNDIIVNDTTFANVTKTLIVKKEWQALDLYKPKDKKTYPVVSIVATGKTKNASTSLTSSLSWTTIKEEDGLDHEGFRYHFRLPSYAPISDGAPPSKTLNDTEKLLHAWLQWYNTQKVDEDAGASGVPNAHWLSTLNADPDEPITYTLSEKLPVTETANIAGLGAYLNTSQTQSTSAETGSVTTTITNTQFGIKSEKYGSDDASTRLPATFAVYDSQGKLVTTLDAQTGDEATTDNLKPIGPGTYTIKEAQSPEGYQKDAKSYQFTLTADGKWQNTDGTAITSVEKAQTTGFYIGSGTTVDLTDYTTDDDKQAATADAAGNVLTFVQYDPPLWTVNVHKQDDASHDPLADVDFKLVGFDKTLTTNSEGDATTGRTLGSGTYTLSETSVPDGYAPLTGSATITIPESNEVPTVALGNGFTGKQLVDTKTHTISITVNERKKGTLPSTGGTGFLKPLELAISIFIASALMFALAWWQKQKAGDAQ